jgi:hypothetical protein
LGLTHGMFGAAGGFLSALWLARGTPFPFEEFLPFRGKWLRLFLTGLLLVLLPMLLRGPLG